MLTLESRQETQAVFLLMRVWGDSEDCSAAEASRSRDSLDSPPLFMVEVSCDQSLNGGLIINGVLMPNAVRWMLTRD